MLTVMITAPKYIFPLLTPQSLGNVPFVNPDKQSSNCLKTAREFRELWHFLCAVLSSWLAGFPNMPYFQNKHLPHPRPSNCDRGHATAQKTQPHCRAGHRSTRGTKNQASVGGCLAPGVLAGPEAARPSQASHCLPMSR